MSQERTLPVSRLPAKGLSLVLAVEQASPATCCLSSKKASLPAIPITRSFMTIFNCTNAIAACAACSAG